MRGFGLEVCPANVVEFRRGDPLHVLGQLLFFGELEQRHRAFLNLRERVNRLLAQGDIPGGIRDDRFQQRNDLLVARVAKRFDDFDRVRADERAGEQFRIPACQDQAGRLHAG